jgi:hypothetical protein
MHRISLVCAAAGIALSAAAVSSPAGASYHLIRWHGTGVCQIWDDSIPTKPWPSDYHRVSHTVPTFTAALALKDRLWHNHTCSF